MPQTPRPTSPRHPRRLRRVSQPVREFMATESASGVVLLLAAVAALAWVNSPWGDGYRALWERHIQVSLGAWSLDEPLHFWVNDVLMVVFFFVVGLEIKRELVIGELSDPRRVVVPIVGALGGLVLPAAIFMLLVGNGPGAHGWGIPIATDIAFAVGVLALAGTRVPFGLRVTLLALAIVDDIGGILIIALFYANGIHVWALGAAVAILLLVTVLQRVGVWYIPVYLLLGAAAWVAVHESGIHTTVLGVALGLFTPSRAGEHEGRDARSPLDRLIHALEPTVAFGITPLFALANSGVAIDPGTLGAAVASPVTQGVVLGLLVGKPVGIVLAVRGAVLLGARLPEGVTWPGIAAMGLVAGIGFTVALFVTGLSYTDPALLTEAKLGIIVASIMAGGCGFVALRLVYRDRHPARESEGTR